MRIKPVLVVPMIAIGITIFLIACKRPAIFGVKEM